MAMNNMRKKNNCLVSNLDPAMNYDSSVIISHLNIRSFVNNKEDIKIDRKIQEAGKICFTETFLDQSMKVLPEDIGRIDMKLFRFD